MQEIWKDIEGYEGLYQISNYGRVKTLSRITNFGNRIKIIPEIIKKLSNDKDGYLITTLSKQSRKKNIKIHRIVADTFIDNPLNKPTVNHKNGIKTDNYVSNLEWATYLENNLHGYNHNLISHKGINNSSSKLNESEVMEIRELYRNKKLKHRELSAMFNVSTANITNILNRKIWKHI
jgi:hypothetical protein